MKKVLILGAVVLLAGSFAQAQSFLWTPNAPNVEQGQVYNSADIWNVDMPPIPLPIPEFDEMAQPGKAGEFHGSSPGPITSIGDERATFGAATGSALVSPRGGSFMTPRRKADMQIRKLIDKLD